LKTFLFVFVILALMATLLFIIGCGNKSEEILPVEGMYRVTGTERTLELREDGSYLLKDGPSGRGGTYEVKGDQVIFEFAGVKADRTGKLKKGTIILDGYEYERQ